MAKVYLLSDYNEYGSENVVGTMDKSKVMELMKSNFSFWSEDNSDELIKTLNEDVASTMPYTLGKGWGGVQLHIIELV